MSTPSSSRALFILAQESDFSKMLHKTELCKYIGRRSCKFGARCRFAHDFRELREKPDLKFTKLCPNLATCRNPMCEYWHRPMQRPPRLTEVSARIGNEEKTGGSSFGVRNTQFVPRANVDVPLDNGRCSAQSTLIDSAVSSENAAHVLGSHLVSANMRTYRL